jgi:hypothetical protein
LSVANGKSDPTPTALTSTPPALSPAGHSSSRRVWVEVSRLSGRPNRLRPGFRYRRQYSAMRTNASRGDRSPQASSHGLSLRRPHLRAEIHVNASPSSRRTSLSDPGRSQNPHDRAHRSADEVRCRAGLAQRFISARRCGRRSERSWLEAYGERSPRLAFVRFAECHRRCCLPGRGRRVFRRAESLTSTPAVMMSAPLAKERAGCSSARWVWGRTFRSRRTTERN